MNIQEAFSSWDAKFSNSVHAKNAYKTGLKIFIGYLRKNEISLFDPVEYLTPDIFIGFPSYLKEYSQETVGVYLSGVKSFMTRLTIDKHLEMTYSESVRWKMAVKETKGKRSFRLVKIPKSDDSTKMVEATREMPWREIEKARNIAMILFLASSGCRNEETTNFLVGDLDLEERTTTVIGKGDKERNVYFSSEASQAIRTYLEYRKALPEQPLFIRHDKRVSKGIEKLSTNAVREIVEEVAEFAGVKNYTPHSFRHSVAIQMLETTHDLAQVQDLLGHSSPNTTRIYATISKEKLQASYRKVFG